MRDFKHFFSLFALAAAVVLSGCASDNPESTADEDFGKVKFKRPDKVTYEQISTRDCELNVPGDVQATAGTPSEIPVQLINHGRTAVIIKEWYMVDQYNFQIFYRKVPADKPLDNDVPYQKYSVRIPARPQPRHAELRLNPGNRAVLNVALPFTGDLAPGETAVFEAFVVTSLNTFKLRSPKFHVYAR